MQVTTVPEVITPPVAALSPDSVTASLVLNGAAVEVNAIVKVPAAIVGVPVIATPVVASAGS